MRVLSGFLMAMTAFVPLAQVAAADALPFSGTVVNLESEARRAVPQDRLMVSMNIDKTEPTAAMAQAAVNAAMQKAKKVYDVSRGVKVTTGTYSVWKEEPYEPGPKPMTSEDKAKRTRWHARQGFSLDSADRDALLKIVGILQQQGVATENMTYYLSREAQDAVKDELTVQALKSIRQQAKAVAEALDMKEAGFGVIGVNTDGGYNPRPVMMMAKGMAVPEAADAAPPVAQGGDSDVTVRVSAEVRLK